MHTSIVRVYSNKYGEFVSNARVVLEWSGFTDLGMSKDVYTHSNGEAEIKHSGTRTAEVFINGSHVGSMDTPGTKIFYID